MGGTSRRVASQEKEKKSATQQQSFEKFVVVPPHPSTEATDPPTAGRTNSTKQTDRVRAFGWKNPRPLAVLRSHEKNVYSVAYSPRIGGLVSGSGDSRVAVWELFPGGKAGGGGGDDAKRNGGGR